MKDHQRVVDPGFTARRLPDQGPPMVLRFRRARTSTTWHAPSTSPHHRFARPATFHDNINTYYSLARLDFLATQKIRLFGSWQYNYQRGTGTSLPQADDIHGQFNPSSTTNPDNCNGGIGYVAPNLLYNTGADITLTPEPDRHHPVRILLPDTQDRGLPSGIRYVYRDTNYPYSTGNAPALASTTALNGSVLPSQFVNSTGWSNIGANSPTTFDRWKRYSFSQDLAFFKSWLGHPQLQVRVRLQSRHQRRLSGYNTADVYVAFNVPYGPQTSNGIARCKADHRAEPVAVRRSRRQRPDGTACQGLWGTVNLRDLATDRQGRRLEPLLLRAGRLDG